MIKYANRPFRDVAEMDAALIANWNAVVQPGDCVYHLGDLALTNEARIEQILAQLAGQKFLILGNHDRTIRKSRALQWKFGWVREMAEIKIDDATAPGGRQSITLLHYAMRVWNKSHHGAWQLYGHSHGSLRDDPHARSLDVGVDACNYSPISYEEVRARMALKVWQPVDHHRSEHKDTTDREED